MMAFHVAIKVKKIIDMLEVLCICVDMMRGGGNIMKNVIITFYLLFVPTYFHFLIGLLSKI